MELSQQMSPEQAEALKKKLENMSPEELQKFQKQQCIFCQIIAGKVPSKKVYDDEQVIGVLDINPARAGHVLLMPKEHFQIMPQVPPELIRALATVTKQVSQAMLRGLQAKGTNIFIANGVAAGQRAQHFMIHVIPRFDDDKVGIQIPEKKMSDAERHTVEKLFSAAPSVVEAEFEDVKDAEKPEQQKSEETPETQESDDESTASKEKEEKDKEDVDLDDIASLLKDQLQ